MHEPLIRFHSVEIDTGLRELRRDGVPQPVEPRVFDLLLFMIGHRDRVITKEELTAAVWPGMVLSETALSRAIMKARKAVGDDAEQQAVIRTVHGHGYRFVAELKEASTQAPVPVRRPGKRFALVLAVAVAGLAIAVPMWLREAPDTAPVADGAIRLAVLPVDDRTADPELSWTRLGLMSYANRLLGELTDLETLSDRRMMSVQDEMPPGSQLEALQAVRASLGASHLVHAQLRKDHELLNLDYRVFHDSGVTAVRTVTGADATRLVRDMAEQVTRLLPGALPSPGFRSVSDNPFVNEAYARGLSLELQGEVARSREYFQAAVNLAPELFWPRYELALMTRDSGDLDLAQSELEALAGHREAGLNPGARAAVHNALGQVHWRKYEYEKAMETYTVGLDAAREAGEARFEIALLTNLGILARLTGDLDRARDYLDRAMALNTQSEESNPAYLFHSMAQVELVAGNLPLAVDYFGRAFESFDAEGNQRGAAASRNNLARLEHRLGRLEAAERSMLGAMDLRERLGDHFGILSSHESLARLYLDLERYADATRHADTLLRMAQEQGVDDNLWDALQLHIEVALAAADAPTAHAGLDRLLAGDPSRMAQLSTRLLMARLALLEGRTSEAVQGLIEVRENGTGNSRIVALYQLGLASPDFDAAAPHWTQALQLAEQDQEVARAGLIRLAMVRRAIAEGRDEAAIEVLNRLRSDHPDWPAVRALVADDQAGKLGVSGRQGRNSEQPHVRVQHDDEKAETGQ